MTHDFAISLAVSHAAADLPIWESIYRQAFPTMIGFHDHRQDGPHQRAGIDRTIVLRNGKVLAVDEKFRGRCAATNRVYGDIALEYVSNDVSGSPGWVEKSLLADYICYLIAPLGRGYLLPVLQLQAAWLVKRSEWLAAYGTRYAHNQGYRTAFCPVPVGVLMPAIGSRLRVTFEPFESYEIAGETTRHQAATRLTGDSLRR